MKHPVVAVFAATAVVALASAGTVAVLIVLAVDEVSSEIRRRALTGSAE